MDNVFHIYGKTLDDHLRKKETNARYLDNRIERFYQEFLSSDVTFEQIESVILCLDNYLGGCGRTAELEYCLMNLRQATFWLNIHGGEDYNNE